MKKLFLLLSLATASTVFTEPFSLYNLYIHGFGGVNFISDSKEEESLDINPGYLIGGTIGYRFSRCFRLELEAAYRRNDIDDSGEIFFSNGEQIFSFPFNVRGDFNSITLITNGIFVIPVATSFIPYVGGGLGGIWNNNHFSFTSTINNFNVGDLKERNDGLVGQVIAGIAFQFTPTMEASLEYRFLDGPNILVNHAIDLNLRNYF